MDSQTSRVHAELTGISIAVEELDNRKITGRNVQIYTDCRQALLALERPLECPSTGPAQEIVVILSSIKGHRNTNGNRITVG